jgi:hypothetical protein
MDFRTREEITAATAVHRELGPSYEDAVAESLVERIGAEVDKRVDAKLAQQGGSQPSPPAPASPPVAASPARSQWAPVTLALGSMLAGILATLAAAKNISAPSGDVFAILFIWIAIVIINISYARRR